MQPQNKWNLKLFEPGMTGFHKLGLAGLYMTLKSLDAKDFSDVGGWNIASDGVELYWNDNPEPFFSKLFKKAFGISKEGFIEFYAHKKAGLSDISKHLLHESLLKTFLQHGQTRKLGDAQDVVFDYDGVKVSKKIKPAMSYVHQDSKALFAKGEFKREIELAGWALPGGAVRHVAFQKPTALASSPEMFLLLIFAPVAALYFTIKQKSTDGSFDNRKSSALVLPEINDLAEYCKAYTCYLRSPVTDLFVASPGEAALRTSLMMSMSGPDGVLNNTGIDSCRVVIFGTLQWSKQQKSRTGCAFIRHVDSRQLNLFNFALRSLKNTFRTTKDGFSVSTSLSRGLISENIANKHPWFKNFSTLMQSTALAKIVSYERKGLLEMVKNSDSDFENERKLIEVIHQALRQRYGMLANNARKRNENPNFSREFERIRSSLLRAKNLQTMRAEITDLLAKGGVNNGLQVNWPAIMPIIHGADWQKTRDLALLALASYSGDGVKDLESDSIVEEEEM